MKIKKRLATITILIKDRQSCSQDVQKILTDNGHLIMARFGVNLQRNCIKNCTGMITIAVDGTAKEIKVLTKKLDSFYGIVAKSSIMTE